MIITALGISSCKTAKVSENTSDAKQDNSEIKTSGEPIISPWVFYEGSTARTMDLIHTELRISFDWEKHWVIGQATLVLKPYFYPQDFVRLDAKGFDIHKIGDLSGDSSYDYQYDGMELLIDLGREISKDDTISIKITYTAKPDEYEEGGSQAIVSDKGLFFIKPSPAFPDKPKQIWTQGETESNSKWFPTIDTPNERCTSDIYVTVDHIYSTLSNGRLVSSQVHGDTARTDHWKMELPHAPYLFMLGIGEFAKVSASSKSLEINYWVEQDYAQHAKAVFGHTPEMIAFFSDLLGVQYPWAKYDQVVVRDFVSGAMENTTAVVFNDGLQLTTREAIDINWDDIISHELFHHWFGNLVTCESWSNLPLNESFATYGEYLWINHKYGKDEADYHHIESLNNYLSEASEKQVDLIRFSYDHREDMFDSHSYDKGGLILHYLRSYVGDEAFFKALNLYLNRNKFKSVEIHDLRLAFEDITGEDLNWFFTQWFFNSGHPILEVSHRHENDTIYIGVEQMQDLTKYPLFRLPVYLDVIREGELMSFPIVVEDKEHEFKLPSKQAPEAVIFDSEHLIVGTVQHFKKPEELITQLMATAHLVSRYEAILKLLSDNTIFTDKAIEIGLLDRSPR
ncbi:MAG: M1 family metallopeptidase, partial [Cyclobacteriaceae bacterium]|nr:M1 family metallopeptidase [Cyclobacteriaceae bacterium HetDA_MAG_MS6]